jgi:hypothetical protein
MAPRIHTRKPSPKTPLDLDRGYFYPGEVVRILKLEGVDYRQLRELFRIVREQAGSPSPEGQKWARFTFRDLVALNTAIRLAGGKEALAVGRRLRLQDLKRICSRLRDLGLNSPLTEIAFRRRGKTVIAQVDGVSFEPVTGQMLLAEVEGALERYLNENPGRLTGTKGRELRDRLQRETLEMEEALWSAKNSVGRLEVSFR